jgi:hypothetical protein
MRYNRWLYWLYLEESGRFHLRNAPLVVGTGTVLSENHWAMIKQYILIHSAARVHGSVPAHERKIGYVWAAT